MPAQKAGMQTSVMKEILRQREKGGALHSAVYDTISGDVRAALKKIDNNIVTIPDKNARLNQIAQDYLAMSPEHQSKTLVLTPANEDREIVNTLIRDGLKNQKKLTGIDTETTILLNRGLTRSERQRVSNYQVKDVVRFNKHYRSLGVAKGSYWRVDKLNKDKNEIHLKNDKGQNILWQPHRVGGGREGAIEIFESRARQLMKGDSIRWLRNDKANKIFNADIATVLKVKGSSAHVLLSNGEKTKINLSKPTHQHWDHAYASTVHAAQGKTSETVLAHGESFRKNLTNQSSFYVTISRAKDVAKIYTDDKGAYLKTLERFTGEKTSALENFSKDVNNQHQVYSEKQGRVGIKVDLEIER
jgi:hypothetical protein